MSALESFFGLVRSLRDPSSGLLRKLANLRAEIVSAQLAGYVPLVVSSCVPNQWFVTMLPMASPRIAGWLRVGFCQGNFNADNCLVGGRTMDYGPFGWLERYDPNFAKWVGSSSHFAFMHLGLKSVIPSLS